MREISSRLDVSLEKMGEYYPALAARVISTETERIAVWKGTVEPVQNGENLREILDDIEHQRPIAVHVGGIVSHCDSCLVVHDHHWWMDRLPASWPVYKLEVQYDGTQTHPRAFVHSPFIQHHKRRKHHFADGALCAYPPWQRVWLWQEHTVVDFMAHVATWLIKWTLWDQLKVWVGQEMRHDPRFLSSVIKPQDECWCGNGKRYADCHLIQDRT